MRERDGDSVELLLYNNKQNNWVGYPTMTCCLLGSYFATYGQNGGDMFVLSSRLCSPQCSWRRQRFVRASVSEVCFLFGTLKTMSYVRDLGARALYPVMELVGGWFKKPHLPISCLQFILPDRSC